MLVNPGSYATFVISLCGIQVSSFTDRSVKLRRNLAIEEKYVFIIKEMDTKSKGLVKFHGTLNLTELSGGTWPIHKQLEIDQLQTSLHLNVC